MNKFLAVVKREYLQRVRTKMFIVVTVLGPLMMALFTVVPGLIFSIKAGGPTRLAIVDETGKLYGRVYQELTSEQDMAAEESWEDSGKPNAMNANTEDRVKETDKTFEASYELEEVRLDGRPLDKVKRDLSERVRSNQLDGYLILPANLLKDGTPEFYGRNAGDIFTRGQVEDCVSRALEAERLAQANIDEKLVREMSRPVDLMAFMISDRGEESDSGQGFYLVFATGFIIYLTILMYGQVVLGAVIEEKETRIAEILFSSVKPFPLMMGKLIGVSLVAFTQLVIWGLAYGAFALYGVGMLAAKGMPIALPHIAPLVIVYFSLFFLLGYFIYATIYALVGSLVTTAQEGSQLAMPIILLLVIGFYMTIPVMKSPNSSLAFWASMFPFFSPITMLVRIVTQTPPTWQVVLSLLIGFATVVLLIWLAARIYRMGMLMYGKKASIPEVWRWVRQA
jgi:ABC-2 type transport system permease protein